HVHLRNIEKKGLIRRRWNCGRAIELRDDHTRDLAARPEIIEIPILGEVAAGAPIEALQRDDEAVELPSSLVGRKDTFVLRVKGDSMIEDSIADGDLIICERRETAEDGQTVVALLRGEEATVKRFYKEKNRIRLQPANANMKPIILTPSQVQVQGVVIGLLRKF
ncbi:MAG: transcriptional repressor LexA, partial [bacterium]